MFGHRPRPTGDRGAAGGPFPLPLGPLGTFGPAGDSGRRDLVVYPVVQGHPRPQLAPSNPLTSANFTEWPLCILGPPLSTRYRRRAFAQSCSGHASTQLRSQVTSAQSDEGWTGARQHETAGTRACSDALIGLAHGRESEASIRHPLQPRPAWHRLRPCGSSLRAQEDLTAIWDVEYSLHFASTSPPFRLEFIALHQG